MRLSLLLIVTAALLIIPQPALAQLLDGVAGGGGPQSDVAGDVAMDANGNHYVTGTFNGTASFGDHSVTAADDDPNNTWSDSFLVKYDAEGEPVWARRGGTGIFNTFGNAVATGPDGSVFWAGYTTALSTFDGGDNPDGELMAVATWEAFIAKYDSDGNLQWVDGLLGPGANTGQGLDVDDDGNVYFAGVIEGSASIGGLSLNAISGRDGFVVKLDPDGEAIWGTVVGGSQSNAAYAVAVHPKGGIVLSGQFAGVATFGSIPLQSSGQTDTFAARIDADGDVVWATKLGAQGSDFNRGVAVGPDGSVYLTGSFEQEILVGTDILASPGFSSVYIARLTPAGALDWGRRIGGSNFDFGESLAVDHQGNVYGTGYVDGSFVVSTGTGADDTFQTAGDSDAYLAVYSPGGDLLSFELAGGTNRDRGAGVAVSDEVGRLAIAGWFRSSITVGEDTVIGPGGNDVFIAFGATIAGGVSTELVAAPAGLALSTYPNPLVRTGTVHLTTTGSQDITIDVFDVLGRRVQVLYSGPTPAGGILEVPLHAADLPAGLYMIRATGDSIRVTRTITVIN